MIDERRRSRARPGGKVIEGMAGRLHCEIIVETLWTAKVMKVWRGMVVMVPGIAPSDEDADVDDSDDDDDDDDDNDDNDDNDDDDDDDDNDEDGDDDDYNNSQRRTSNKDL